MDEIRHLVKTTRDNYDDIITPDVNTIYFLTDSAEVYIGTTKLGSGFIWTDTNRPRPEIGITGYFYIDRKSLDMYIWNEQIYRWIYFGNAAANNALSISKFQQFKQEVIDKMNKLQHTIDEVLNTHLYTETRLYFKTDDFFKIPDTDYYGVTLAKDPKYKKLLCKTVIAHIAESETYQTIYPDVSETEEQVIIKMTIPVEGFCILS